MKKTLNYIVYTTILYGKMIRNDSLGHEFCSINNIKKKKKTYHLCGVNGVFFFFFGEIKIENFFKISDLKFSTSIEPILCGYTRFRSAIVSHSNRSCETSSNPSGCTCIYKLRVETNRLKKKSAHVVFTRISPISQQRTPLWCFIK